LALAGDSTITSEVEPGSTATPSSSIFDALLRALVVAPPFATRFVAVIFFLAVLAFAI
jgi:hypothetical protein